MYFVYIMEIIGTIAFSFSGAMLGIKKELDILGVAILGVITAMGGGVLRDLLLGALPPVMFTRPDYAIAAAAMSILLFVWCYFREESTHSTFMRRAENVMLLADTIGLAVFTVTGVKRAFEVGPTHHLFLVVVVGTLTGVGGGVLRDVLVNMKPYIFVKHVYALSSIIGAIVCALLWKCGMEDTGMILGAVAIVLMRALAIRFQWNLPKASFKGDAD